MSVKKGMLYLSFADECWDCCILESVVDAKSSGGNHVLVVDAHLEKEVLAVVDVWVYEIQEEEECLGFCIVNLSYKLIKNCLSGYGFWWWVSSGDGVLSASASGGKWLELGGGGGFVVFSSGDGALSASASGGKWLELGGGGGRQL
ncbi:hypothetical protein Tco_0162676 [Tanacetum coccineum]